MIQISKYEQPSAEAHFLVKPRDFMSNSVVLPLEVIKALNETASILKNKSNGRYEIIVTRGYINWNLWRRIRGILAKTIFCLLHWNNRNDAKLLFSSNGHDDGLSVDIQLYDAHLRKTIKFLSWRNVIISRTKAQNILEANRSLIDLLDLAMSSAGFVAHPDPREKLQMHYRLAL